MPKCSLDKCLEPMSLWCKILCPFKYPIKSLIQLSNLKGCWDVKCVVVTKTKTLNYAV